MTTRGRGSRLQFTHGPSSDQRAWSRRQPIPQPHPTPRRPAPEGNQSERQEDKKK